LIVAWPLIFPAIKAGFVYALAGGRGAGLDAARDVLLNEPYAGGGLAHLWFIWQLFLLSVAAVIVRPMVMRIDARARERALDRFARVAPTTRGCLMIGAISVLTLLPMQTAGLDTSVALLPAPRVLVAYAVCFGFGWLLFARPVVLASMTEHPWQRLGVGVFISSLHLLALATIPAAGSVTYFGALVTCGFALWFLAYGLIGLGMRYFGDARPASRHLADASYWMYILHLPVVIWLAGALSPLALPAIVKFTIVLGGTTLVTLVSYHYCVRSTALGVLLSGRRYPRAVRQDGH
jgi:peptidoglycan/LPS O-acetylase OafA/YrhL